MAVTRIKEKAQALFALAEKLVEVPGLTWVDASNVVYCPGGPYVRLFRTQAERAAFRKSKEGRRIDELIWSLPEPPVRPETEILDSKFFMPIPIRKRRRSLPNGPPAANGAAARHPARPVGKRSR